MQPYWIPYAGYFRLIAASDIFVVFDDVQFPRRGYVHRNKLLDRTGVPEWITLPLAKATRDAKINEVRFHDDARELLTQQQRRFPVVEEGFGVVEEAMRKLDRPVVELLVDTLMLTANHLGLDTPMLLSSELGESTYRGQERILRIVKSLEGNRYLNASGGRELYEENAFAEEGVELDFLPEWRSGYLSILEVIDDAEVRAEIVAA